MTPLGVATPLHELCEMVRRGEIPHWEVGELVEKYKNRSSARRTLEQLLEELRTDANQIDDVSLQVSAWAFISTVSHNDKDVKQACNVIINSRESDNIKAENLTVVVRALAESGKAREALRVAAKIKKLNGGWYAEALLHIAGFSCNKKLLKFAHGVIEDKVLSRQRQGELLGFYEEVEEQVLKGEVHHPASQSQKKSALADLVLAFSQLGRLREVHTASSRLTSTSARFKVRKAIASALAKTME